jgi:hypothetical protein
MADKRISDLTELVYAGVTNDDLLAILSNTDGNDKKIKYSTLAAKVLGNKTIGGTGAGDIATIDGTQTLTNKRLTSPGINSATACTMTSEQLNNVGATTSTTAELNKLTAVTTTAAQFNYLNTATSNIQTQLNALAAVAESATSKTYIYSYGFTTGVGVTTLNRTQAQILSDMSISAVAYCINHVYIIPTLYMITPAYVLEPWDAAGVTFKFAKQTLSGQDQLDDIDLTGLTAEKDYLLVMTFKIQEVTGV